jgi:hypothetical protein
MEYSGDATGWVEVVCGGDRDAGRLVAFRVKAPRVVGGVNMHVEGVDEHVQPPDQDLEPPHEARLLLPSLKALVAIEQTPMRGWPRWLGDGGAIDGARTVGASASPRTLIQKFGSTPGVVARIARDRVAPACEE